MNTIEIQRMAAAGVPEKDIFWYLFIARPRAFSKKGDVKRAKAVLGLVAEYCA
jgi:hypothetical protein